MPAELKYPFNISLVVRRIRNAVQSFPKAAMFALRDEGYASLFEQLIACIISIRTRDELTVPIVRRLFSVARGPEALSRLGIPEIDRLIRGSTFHEAKAKTIHRISSDVARKLDGALPCDSKALLSFPGVGPKCANLALGVACGKPAIAVDIHVHRVVNRWGYVSAKTPEATLAALEARLPRRYWIELNELLVPFGKRICTGTRPLCSGCPVVRMCRQIGVRVHR